MEPVPESEDLLAFEKGVNQDPQILLQYISSWEGFDWFWQLIVSVTYAEQVDLRDRLERALLSLAALGPSISITEIAERLLRKVHLVDELTHEELLFQQVQRLALILVPSAQVGVV